MKTSMAWYDPAEPNPTGTATDTQWGWLILDEPAIPGQWFIDTASQVILPDPALSTAEANEFVGTQLPEGEIVWTTWLRPGPLGGEGVRVHGITSEATDVVVAQWVIGDESGGEVVKIMMAAPQAQ